MSGKKVLVTGGTGYIGVDLVERLLKNSDISLALVVRDIKKAEALFSNRVEYILYEELTAFTKNIEKFAPNVVLHLAAYSTSSDEPSEVQKLIESNIIFTSNLMLALTNCKVEMFINTGSFSEYHNSSLLPSPTYLYSATKTSARYIIEYYAKKSEFKFVNLVLFSVYGKGSSKKKIIDYALDSLDAATAVNMSDGKQVLDFVHVDDVVALYSSLVLNYEGLKFSKIDYEIGTGECFSIRELVQKLEILSAKEAHVAWGANRSRKLDTLEACADIKTAQIELNYTVNISLYDGLRRYIKSES